MVATLAWPAASASAQPPGNPSDNWALERHPDDPRELERLWQRLVRNPHDERSFRGLWKVDSAAWVRARAKESHRSRRALAVVRARIALADGQSKQALAWLKPWVLVEGSPATKDARLWHLVARAHKGQKAWPEAVRALLTAAANDQLAKRRHRTLDRALDWAARHGTETLKLEVLRTRHKLQPQSRLAFTELLATARSAGAVDTTLEQLGLWVGAEGTIDADLGGRPWLADLCAALRDHGQLAGAQRLATILQQQPLQSSYAAETRRWTTLDLTSRRTGSHPAFIKTLRRALAGAHARNAAAWRTLALARQFAGQPAGTAWSEALSLRPRDRDLWEEAIDASRRLGDHEAVIALVMRRGSRGASFDTLLALARSMSSAGEESTALELAEKLGPLARNSRDTVAVAGLFSELRDHESSAATLRLALKARPRDPQLHSALAQSLIAADDVDAALAAWKSAARNTRPQHAGWASVASAMSEHAPRHRRLWPETLSAIERALAVRPKEVEYLRAQALFEEARGRLRRAIEAWDRTHMTAAQGDHDRVRDEARHRLVELLLRPGSMAADEIRDGYMTRARERIEDENPAIAIDAARFLAEIHDRRNATMAAVEVLARITERFPAGAEHWILLATALQRADRAGEARRAIERAIELAPEKAPELLSRLAELSLQIDDIEGAAQAARRSVDAREPSRRRALPLIRLAHALTQRGQLERAREALDLALHYAPHEPTATKARAEHHVLAGEIVQAAQRYENLLASDKSIERLDDGALVRAVDVIESAGMLASVRRQFLRRIESEAPSVGLIRLALSLFQREDADEVRAWLGELDDAPRLSRRLAQLLAAPELVGHDRLLAQGLRCISELDIELDGQELLKLAENLPPLTRGPKPLAELRNQARREGLRTAGRMRDPAVVPHWLAKLTALDTTKVERRIAAWSLAHLGIAWDAQAAQAVVNLQADPFSSSLICIALIRGASQTSLESTVAPTTAISWPELNATRDVVASQLCAVARDMTRPQPLESVLRAPAPDYPSRVLTGQIRAWQMRLPGSIAGATPAARQWLVHQVLGPPGARRRAAAVTITSLVTDSAAPAWPPLPDLHANRWRRQLANWVSEWTAASSLAPNQRELGLRLSHSGWDQALHAALTKIPPGTNAHSDWTQRWLAACEPSERPGTDPDDSQPGNSCLAKIILDAL